MIEINIWHVWINFVRTKLWSFTWPWLVLGKFQSKKTALWNHKRNLLTHFRSIFHHYTPWKRRKTSSFLITAWKLSKYGVISGPYFSVLGLNTEIYGVNLRILSKYRKIRTRNNFVFGHFLRSACFLGA